MRPLALALALTLDLFLAWALASALASCMFQHFPTIKKASPTDGRTNPQRCARIDEKIFHLGKNFSYLGV